MISRHAIEVRNLSKRFGTLQALGGVDFTVDPKSVFCILGPNGAGKTTLLRILTTVTRQDDGKAWINGFDTESQAVSVRGLIGVVAQENHFDRYLSIWHNLTLHAEMHGVPKAEYESEIRRLLEMVGLYERRNEMTENLSGGMQRRVSLIRALIHKPKVLFLDEPTTGLDPQARREIWETIQQFKTESTVILTTHYMEEADLLSDRILMLHHGKVMMTGTPRELKQAISARNCYEMVFDEPKAGFYLERFKQTGLSATDTLKLVDDFNLSLTISDPDELHGLLNLVDMDDLQRVGRKEADLEAVFMAVANAPKHTPPPSDANGSSVR